MKKDIYTPFLTTKKLIKFHYFTHLKLRYIGAFKALI